MAFKCRSCSKISRGKKAKSLTTVFKKHKCQGCGSTDFFFISDSMDLIYDFDELVFDVVSSIDMSTSRESQMIDFNDDVNKNNRYFEPVAPVEMPEDHVRGPSITFTPTFHSPSFHDDTRSSFDSHHSHSFDSHSSYDSGSSYDSSSSDSSSSCDCGSCGSD